MKHYRYALVGASGYIAPRHMKAISETDGELIAAFDPNDSVGIIDSYFPKAHFFTEFERFDRFVDKTRRRGEGVDFVSICSPNYLHDAHVRFALRSGADAICEKPLVLNPWNIDALQEMESELHNRVYSVLQLRLHPAIVGLKKKIDESDGKTFDVDLTYITSRGRWYSASWKGDQNKSGGIATNIGVHFFDMLVHLFGTVRRNVVHLHEASRAAGYLEFGKANVRWFLSINSDDIPETYSGSTPTYRSITVGGEEVEFSGGFTDLHTETYRGIHRGEGFSLADARPSIELTSQIRTSSVEVSKGEMHPSVGKIS